MDMLKGDEKRGSDKIFAWDFPFMSYLANGICEEYVYNRLQFSYGWCFTFVQGFLDIDMVSRLYFEANGESMEHVSNYWAFSWVLMD
ncbi:hypothetical protein J1N35_031172 [Gossypium stocksii]|uniref:Uncharacterized protein n=1 Tax=Gossypium stocksii TaxID=47602 RepID=A0A9D3V1F4_9ROSI|nr:hypothetical protein J1N35_031172 [Gossypium stocksii]